MIPKGWKEGRVGDVIEKLESGVSVNGEDRPLEKGEKGVLRVSSVTYGVFDPNAAKAIVKSDLGRSKCSPRKDRVIISRSNTGDLVGASAYVDKDYPNLYLSDKLWQTVPKPGISMRWLSYVLASDHSRYLLSRLATGTSGSMKNITKDELLSMRLSIPPYSEQEKIAEVICKWDEAICKVDSILNKKKKQRMVFCQEVVTGKRRISSFVCRSGFRSERYGNVPLDWDFVDIGSFSSQSIKKNFEGKDIPVLSCSKHDGFVSSLSYFNKKVYSDDLSGYKLIKRGEFGFPSNHIEEGSIGLQKVCDEGLVSPIYVVFMIDGKKVDGDFLYSVLKTDLYRQVFSASTNSSVDRRGSLRWKEFSDIKVALPPLEEQKAIANVLAVADAEIETLQQRLDCLRREKRALMQQLLTGKRRVKVEEEAVA